MFVWTRVLSYETLEVKGVQPSSETRPAAARSPNTCDRTAAEAAATVRLQTCHANTNQAANQHWFLFSISL